MKLVVKRFNPKNEPQVEETIYEVQEEGKTLLEVLSDIKQNIDKTLSFRSGCRSSVCGSCAMQVNDKEVLACSYKPKDGDVISPLNAHEIKRDLIVDIKKPMSNNMVAKAFSSSEASYLDSVQSDCILCGSCYSACPVYTVNEDFIGPFSLTRSWRYVSEMQDDKIDDKIESIQTNGVWDCTQCGECYPVCPQGINPQMDIMMLRNKSGMKGYTDPKFSQGFGGDFGGGFGNDFNSFGGFN